MQFDLCVENIDFFHKNRDREGKKKKKDEKNTHHSCAVYSLNVGVVDCMH